MITATRRQAKKEGVSVRDARMVLHLSRKR